MNQSLPLRKKPFKLGKVVMPILITQVAMYLMTFFDILMTGRYNTEHLAGVTIGSSFWVPIYLGLTGILMGLTPIIAHQAGAKKNKDIRSSVQQGIYIAFVLSAIVFFIIYFGVDLLLQRMTLEDTVQIVARQYLQGLSYGLIPLFIYTVLRSFFDALGATRVSMTIVLISAPINVFLNYVFIYGNFGAPELGGAGAAYASAITYWIVLLIACGIAWQSKSFVPYRLFSNWEKALLTRWKEILFIGLPIGLSIFVEVSIFSAVTLFMANYSTATISAHQIALNFTSLLYNLPLSIAMGATILVGQEVGANRFKDAKQYSYIGVALGIFFSIASIIILLIFKEQIASIYTTDKEIIALATKFFVFAAFFQLSDAVQAPVQGALRGYKDVNVTFIMAVISYWVIGLPVGYSMATFTNLGPYGYWIGLIAGLTVGAITLGLRLHYIQKKRFI